MAVSSSPTSAGAATARCRQARKIARRRGSSSTAIRCVRSGTSRGVGQRDRRAPPRGSGAWRRNRSAHRRSPASAGASKQHRHQPRMRRGEHRQHEFDAVAEQDRDAVAALAGRVCETPPRSARIAARLRASSSALSPQTSASPSGFRATASAIIAQMLFGRSQNAGTMRSPKRGSSRIGGMECCDQSIGAPRQLLVFMS